MYDIIIIGSGPAGLSAAIYATRYNLKTLVLGNTLGMITEAHKVENWPGEKSIHGYDLMQKFQTHAEELGAEVLFETVVSIENNNNQFQIKTEAKEFEAKSIIIAAGTQKRRLNIEQEEKYLGRGLSYCATCDGPFFKDKSTAVIGGGNAALMAAHILAQTASKVYIIYRGPKFKAQPSWVDKVKEFSNVEFIMNSNVVKLFGEDKLEKIELDTNKTLDVEGLFVEIGSIPTSTLTEKIGIELDRKYVKVNKDQSTNIPGVFAAGDITTNSNMFRQVVTAASEGAIAANSAFQFIRGMKNE